MIPRMSRALPLLLAILPAVFPGTAHAALRDVLDKVVETYEHHEFRLAVDLHAPDPGGQAAPSLDAKGWHHNDAERPILLAAGEEVEVTAVLNYGDKAVFLEIARKDSWRPVVERTRLRVRFASDAPPEKPEDQMKDILFLISRTLKPISP